MTNENNIDKLFRDKLYHRDFEFESKHWVEAEKLIEAGEKGKKYRLVGKKYLAIISIALMVLAGAGWFMLSKTNDNKIESKKNNSFENPPVNTNSPVNTITGGETGLLTERKKENGTEAEKTNSYNEKNPKINSISISSEIAITNTGLNHSDGKNYSASGENINLNELASKEETKPSEEKMGFLSGNSENNQNEPPVFSQNNGNPENKLPDAALEEPGLTPPSQNNVQQYGHSTLPGNETLPVAKENEPQNSEKTAVKEGDSDNPQVDSEILMPSVITLNKEPNPESPAENESALTMEKQQETKIPLKDRLNWLRHISVGVSGGINFSQGLVNTANTRADMSARPIGTLRFAYQINDQVDIESGLIYDYRAGLNSSITTMIPQDLTTTITRYSTSATTSLHYIDLPVHLTYKYGKHSFVVGMHYAQLVNTRNEIVNSKTENGIKSIEGSSEKWSKNDGRFSSFDLAAIFGYDYALTDRLKICGRINYGLFDVTDDNSFGNSVRDKNKQVRMLLEYRFMKY